MIKNLFLIACFSVTAFSQSPKRGIAYGDNSTADLLLLKPGVSWWYNWGSSPENDTNANYGSIGVEYVPMAWGTVSDADVQAFINRIKPGAKYLLAFNEPNFNDGARLTPQEAVNAWANVEKIAAAKNLEIVSAAPAYNGPNNYGGYTSPLDWHDQFFLLCPNCKVDYIAFHTYDSSSGSVIGVTGLLKKYNRPVWVTEFANRVIQTAAEKTTFMKEVVTSFENDPDIYRYSWFTGRVDPAKWPDMAEGPLLELKSSVLRPIGTEYINVSYTTKKMNVPGRITANKHYRRKGTTLQNTTDSGTVQNVSSIETGDWNEFMINVANAGTYKLTFRVASTTIGKFDILVNDVVVKTDETFAATGAVQTYTNKIVSGVVLPKGEVYLKIKFKSNGMNFNYIDTALESLGINDPVVEKDSFTVYPNPIKTQSTLHIKSDITEPLSLKIVDMKGIICFSSDEYLTNEDIKIGEKLSTGVYIVNAAYGSIKKSIKIIKN
jgi:hypothetical protein